MLPNAKKRMTTRIDTASSLPHWQWLTVGEVARALRLTEERVRQLIRQRQIKATKIGGWLVQPADLSAFVASRSNMAES